MKHLVQAQLLLALLVISALSVASEIHTQNDDLAVCSSAQLTDSDWKIYRSEKTHAIKGKKLKISETSPDVFKVKGAINGAVGKDFNGACDGNLYVIAGSVEVDNCMHKLTIRRNDDDPDNYYEDCDGFFNPEVVALCKLMSDTRHDKHIFLRFDEMSCVGGGIHTGHAHGGNN